MEERVASVKEKLLEVRAEALEENGKEGNEVTETEAAGHAEGMFKEYCKHDLLQRKEVISPGTKSLKQVL